MDPKSLSPYLSAIQQVPGAKPGEKYKNLNETARKIIADTADQCKIEVNPTEQYNKLITPLIKLEIAKILHQPKVVAEALISEDSTIFNRALRVKWFFDKTYDNITNVNYFEVNIFPFAPLKNRFSIIRALGAELKDKIEAQKFYEYISKTYNHHQAWPLLFICEESFIWKSILNQNIELKLKEVERLYYKYPNLIINYLRLSKKKIDVYDRQLLVVDIKKYSKFLQKLLKKHPEVFIELIKKHNSNFNIKLTREYTDIFFKKLINEFIDNPHLYMSMTHLKMINAKLTKKQYIVFFKNLFPKYESYFSFDEMKKYLIYFLEEEKFPLITSTFEEIYGVKFTDNKSRLSPSILKQLPREERIKQARILLVDDNQFPTDPYALEYSWRCYLPADESIPLLKAQILKTQGPEKRVELLKQMIFSCKINEDQDALLDVLTYVTTKHKNEATYVLSGILHRLYHDFNIKYLNRNVLKVLIDFSPLLLLKNVINESDQNKIVIAYYGCEIKYKLENNLLVDEEIKLLIQLNMRSDSSDWNMPKDNLPLERYFLHTAINLVPIEYCKNYDKKVLKWNNILLGLIYAIYDFQERNLKSEAPIDALSVMNYQFLLIEMRKILVESYDNNRIKEILKLYEPALYADWVEETKEDIVKKPKKKRVLDDIETLKYNPQHVEKYLETFYEDYVNKYSLSFTQRFIKALRWHNNLPIKMAEICLNNWNDPKKEATKNIGDLAILALLLEGPEFEAIVALYIPNSDKIDTENEVANKKYEIQKKLPQLLNTVQPPVSLDLLLPYCKGEYLQLGLRSLISVCRRSSIHKVMAYAERVLKFPTSAKKHGIELCCLVADINSLREILIQIWRKDKHQSIHELVFKRIFDIFKTTPNANTWKLMSECIDGLNPKDIETLNQLIIFNKIPNEYITVYVDHLVNALERLKPDLEKEFYENYICNFLKSIYSIAPFCSEELHQRIIKIYLLNMTNSKKILSSASHYCIHTYFAVCKEENLKIRIEFIYQVFTNVISNHWNDSNVDEPTYYPGKFVIKMLYNKIMDSHHNFSEILRLVKAVQKAVATNLQPYQDLNIYASLLFASLFNDTDLLSQEFTNKLEKVYLSLIQDLTTQLFFSVSASFVHVVNWVSSHLVNGPDKSLWNFNFTKNLLNHGNQHLAVKLLYDDNFKLKQDEDYWKMIYALQESEDLTVKSIANMIINNNNY